MIQRKQTLFLMLTVFLGVSLLFFPCICVKTIKNTVDVFLIPLNDANITSSPFHLTAVGINFVCLIISAISILVFKKRKLQLKLSYLILLIWIVLSLTLIFFPVIFINKNEFITEIKTSYFSFFICSVATLSAFLAAIHVNKDIKLLKNSERIR